MDGVLPWIHTRARSLSLLASALAGLTIVPPRAASQVPPEKTDTSEQRLEVAAALRQGAAALSADQAAAIAVRTAPSVARANAASRRARAAAGQALIALYPQVELEGRYTRLAGVDDVVFPTGDRFPPQRDRYLLEARATLPLSDLFLQILPRYRAAKDTEQAQALNAVAETHNVALLAREAFYNYARARATALVARASVEQTEAQLRDVASMVTAGSMARVELMRAEAQVASAKGAMARTNGAVAVARTALYSLLHREDGQDVAISEPFDQPLPPLEESNERLLQRAVSQRSELRALNALLSAQERTIDAAAAGRFPKLAVGATYDYAKPNPYVFTLDPEPPWSDNWLFFGAVSWSPNDFAVAGKQVSAAEADRAQTEADVQAMRDGLRREVVQAAEDYRSAGEAMDAGLVGIRAAEESYRVRREQFRAGAAVATDVIDSEAELRRARLELINAAIDVRIARARLDRALESRPEAGNGTRDANQP